MNTLINDLFQLFLRYQEINLRYKIVVMVCSVNITKILWNTFIEDKTAQCRGNNSCDFFSIYDTCSSDLDRSLMKTSYLRFEYLNHACDQLDE